jgi:hypothetical protein
MNLMSSQKNFFCISLNINQSLLKLLHVGIHYKAEKLMSIVFFFIMPVNCLEEHNHHHIVHCIYLKVTYTIFTVSSAATRF